MLRRQRPEQLARVGWGLGWVSGALGARARPMGACPHWRPCHWESGLCAGDGPLRSQRSLREEDVSRGERRDRGGVGPWWG